MDLAGIGLTTGVKKVLALLNGGSRNERKAIKAKRVAKSNDDGVGWKGTRKRVGEDSEGEADGEI